MRLQIFKHHISVVEGHLKMIDMVRKHTVEGSGNWRMICELVDRTNEMLRVSKQQARSFVHSTLGYGFPNQLLTQFRLHQPDNASKCL